MQKNFDEEKLADLANYELFAKKFLTNIHRYIKNALGICTDFRLFAKCFVRGVRNKLEILSAVIEILKSEILL